MVNCTFDSKHLGYMRLCGFGSHGRSTRRCTTASRATWGQEMTDLADLVLDENEDHVAARCRIAALTAPVVRRRERRMRRAFSVAVGS